MGAKYIFVTGGVVSSLGKGITAASLGRLLKCRGIKVTMQKMDPYFNVDPGTMSPYQHGEVFVTDDGAETDLDLGHYERFIDEPLSSRSNLTSGHMFKNVIDRERRGGYLGATVQIIPHITGEIRQNIYAAGAHGADVVIVEVGGTVGDMEGQPFLETIRQIRNELPPWDTLLVHVTLIPYLRKAGEIKTKPTQHSVRELGGLGLKPDILVCRSEVPVPEAVRDKIAMFCNMAKGCVFPNLDADTLYEIPLHLHKERLDEKVCELMGFGQLPCDLTRWQAMVEESQHHEGDPLRIALVGKYVELPDAYMSVVEALKHAAIPVHRAVSIDWIKAEELTAENVAERLKDADGLVVPGGFGARGLEGKIAAIAYARENGLPFLGLCLGMQMAVVEFARHVLKLPEAHTTEVVADTPDPVIDLMTDQDLENLGGTMRLGAYRCRLTPGSVAQRAYSMDEVSERHRHRYEFNNAYLGAFESAGMRFTGRNPERELMEIAEIPAHPFFVGVQFHPEFKSRPDRPHPLFQALIHACLTHQQG